MKKHHRVRNYILSSQIEFTFNHVLINLNSILSFYYYKVRTKTAIEHLLNLTNAGHALMKILPYEDEKLSAYRDKSPQEIAQAPESIGLG